MGRGSVAAWHVLRPDEGEDMGRRLLVERSSARLSPAQSGLASLAFLEELTYAGLAGHLYIPFGTVKCRLSSALAKLRGKEGP